MLVVIITIFICLTNLLHVEIEFKISFGFDGKSDNSVFASAYLGGDGVVESSSNEKLSDELSQMY